ncbi:hypothetical protein [Vibrio sp. Isolate24]|uniref:hypothetical protein n=1 Tax=Vibrio sp. Isolate24 TaxID=2908534 RepID=UPI001EFE7584|nr:hypothetical protein [Vibrio sp. Isolate24]MCG9679096.1 hypothetical protein [Vibrio sp. Isolate24]
MENEWRIEGEWDWEMKSESIRYYVSSDESRHIFRVSRMALVDYFQTEDTKQKAIELFEGNQDRLLALSVKLLEEGEHGDVINVNHDTCVRLAL